MDRVGINGRDVFIVDAHHEILAAWAEIRQRLGIAPHLITFDSHTDSHRAFMRHIGKGWDAPDLEVLGRPLVDAIRIDDPTSISRAIEQLANDEHIDWACRVGIIDQTFIFLGALSGGQVRLPATMVFEDVCLPSCAKVPHDDDCLRLYADHVLEPIILHPRIDKVQAHLGSLLVHVPYILDIDLDVFLTRRAAQPIDPSLFRFLLHHAAAITIAREPGCVEALRLPGEEITAAVLELLVLDHIRDA